MDQAVDTFLKTLLKSGLLNRAQLQTALRAVPEKCRENAQELADQFIKQGKLSRFQAHKLLQGAALGLMLGPYQILTPIGRGGMGSVYLALDSRSGQRLALKVLPPKKALAEERYLARFRREMELSQRVRHANVALTYEVGESNGVHYIAMEYIPGVSLHRLVNKEGPLTVGRAARLFAEVCSGLEHAHSQGLIHRDLKPSNIMVTPNDHAKILDLGLALMEGEVAEDSQVIGGHGYVVGSMDYIAPEQIQDATGVDVRADIYSLGCSLYHALAGRPPFPGGDNRLKIKRHRFDEPEPITRINPKVPEEFAGLIRKMMAKKPERRFASAYDVRGELLAWASGDPVLPMDKQGDKGFEQAVIDLETGAIAGELISNDILQGGNAAKGPDRELATQSEPRRDYLWIVLGLVGFWLIVLTGLGIAVLCR
jgi:serine/threonine protein kinase